MSLYREAISELVVNLPRRDLRTMIRTVRALYRLSTQAAYRQAVLPQLPEAARFDPGHNAVMMGYDFHLTEEGPRLIEVNTNAGGALLSYLAHHADEASARKGMSDKLKKAFLGPFAQEMQAFSQGRQDRPRHIAIIDEAPQEQFLYHEMEVFADLFRDWGVDAQVVDPQRLQADAERVTLDGAEVDLIYNRHCDFYLEEPAMAGIRAAYLAGRVCLTPNPFVYGLLGDKRRMVLWSDPAALAELGVEEGDIALLQQGVPVSRLLQTQDPDVIWKERRGWVFKPVDRFGSRGVLVGEKISRKRFNELDTATTLVQQLVAPSLTPAAADEKPMKTDLRLFVYRDRVVGIGARLYRGQVTNLRTEGGGFARVKVVL
ncbi:hypothetical protein Pcar_3032 [Syntrophotalea carbinolica DSM 2380]|uniref:Circularly permuted type 2 ATP-grasp protein n=1 Tax=Syntrophotalea carbinolica (strain DSM 2380 / NBRC 103641 / GraBd1) TaxID=338963 RepID=Q3A040_SYNC1|nr:hypothetical protein [Syntrophotalea carbinolica]ABA90267.1 hypothetical protein Pcar_3032 [Syntrophotalea carbinolica DSM 2380]